MKKVLFSCILMVAPLYGFSQILPYQNPNLTAEQRATDLCSRLTLEEKTSLMMDASPAIKRLNIPAFQWWNEALHGVARNGLATVFPEPIGMAASWDSDLLLKVFTATSDEARAKSTDCKKKGQTERYQGLSFWTPNINIFRDPRWGRGMETYGEDPYLTGILGMNVVKGLQGDGHSRYYKLYACAKHFAIHSGPEWSRHQMNIEDLSPRDLYETYLPAFKDLVQKAGVKEVMCAYQRFDGEPCCGNNRLLQQILRNEWGFKGLVVSDCGAISDFWIKGRHEVSPDGAHASAKGVGAGTDVECGNTYRNIPEAVKAGLISEDAINRSVIRLLKGRMELGDFDPDFMVEWTKIPMSVVASQEHKDLSLQMARESMTLLQNKNNILPLKTSGQKIMVMGPNADDGRMQWGNYNGFPNRTVTILDGIKQFMPGVKYVKACEFCSNETQESRFDELSTTDGKKGLSGKYWNNLEMEGETMATQYVDNPLGFATDGSSSFNPGGHLNLFASTYEGVYRPTKSEEVKFEVTADDGCRLIVNNDTVIKRWNRTNERIQTAVMQVEAGKSYNVKLDYMQKHEYSNLIFDIKHKVNLAPQDAAAMAKDADIVVFVGGLSPSLEGEEMKVSYEGFKGGDRTSIELPKAQRDVIAALKKMGKKVIFVNCSGSAIAMQPESQNAEAILQAWYPGEQGGTAVAEVLFGKVNPSGKLPVTFYRDDSQLPDFSDYSMKNRTYRYFTGKPLFAFGHGLSYTTFAMGDGFIIGTPGKNGKLSINIKNTGKMDGSTVMQLYVRSLDDANSPIKSLKGFKRIELKKGEAKDVVLDLNKDVFERFDENTNTVHFVEGNYEIMYGTGSDAQSLKTMKIKL